MYVKSSSIGTNCSTDEDCTQIMKGKTYQGICMVYDYDEIVGILDQISLSSLDIDYSTVSKK